MSRKKKKTSRKKRLVTATNLLSIGALARPAIQHLAANKPLEEKIDSMAVDYLGYSTIQNKFTSEAIMRTATTYGSAAIPKIAKKALSALGFRHGWI